MRKYTGNDDTLLFTKLGTAPCSAKVGASMSDADCTKSLMAQHCTHLKHLRKGIGEMKKI